MAVIPVIALVLLSAALLAPGLVIGPSLDAAVFSHVAGQMLHGVPPYLGAWDHKPPGIYLAAAASQALLGWLGPWTAEWLLSVAATAGMGVCVAAALKRLGVNGGPRALAAAGAVLFSGQYLLALGGGLSEPLAAALVAWALVWGLRPTGRWQMVLIGVISAGALLVSPQVLPAVPVVVALAAAAAPASARISSIALLGTGIILPIAGTTTWLVLSGILPAAIDAVVAYAAAYRGASGEYGVTLGAPVASWTVLASLFLITPAILGIGSRSRAAVDGRRAIVASLLWIIAACVLIVAQGRFYAHYVIPLAVPLGILAGFGLQRLGSTLRPQRTVTARGIMLAPLLATVVISAAAGVVGAAMQIAPLADRTARMQAVAERLGDLPDGSLFVWGNEPRLYELAGRDPASRYSYLYPLTTPGYSIIAMVDAVARELAAHPPEVVVDAGSTAPGQPGFLPLLVPRPLTTDGRDLDLLDPLRNFIAARYELAATVAGWPIYVLRNGAAP